MTWCTPLLKHDADGVPCLIQEVHEYIDHSEYHEMDREKLAIKLFNGHIIYAKKLWIEIRKPYNLPYNLEKAFFMQKLESFVMENYKTYYESGWKDGKEVRTFGV
jgi:hypothetical protein